MVGYEEQILIKDKNASILVVFLQYNKVYNKIQTENTIGMLHRVFGTQCNKTMSHKLHGKN